MPLSSHYCPQGPLCAPCIILGCTLLSEARKPITPFLTPKPIRLWPEAVGAFPDHRITLSCWPPSCFTFCASDVFLSLGFPGGFPSPSGG